MTLPAAPGADAAAVAASVHPGDRVRVALKDRRSIELTVAVVEPEALVGEGGERVVYTDIARLERRTIDKTKTGLLIASPLLALGALFIILIIVNPPF